jgi:hypothetical protein
MPTLNPRLRGIRAEVLAALLLTIGWKRKSVALRARLPIVAPAGLTDRLLLRDPADPEQQRRARITGSAGACCFVIPAARQDSRGLPL